MVTKKSEYGKHLKQKWARRRKAGRAAENKVLARVREELPEQDLMTEVPVMPTFFAGSGGGPQKLDILIPKLSVCGEIKAATTKHTEGRKKVAKGAQELSHYLSGIYSRGIRIPLFGVIFSGDLRLWSREWDKEGRALTPRWKEREWGWLKGLPVRRFLPNEKTFWLLPAYFYRGKDLVKWCSNCEEGKPTTDFNNHKGRADGLNVVCRECSRALSKTHYENKRKK